MSKVMLIDGNSLTYRAFFALPIDLATASGQVTNAVFGFTSMLINLWRDHEPDLIVVAFDRPEPTFRHNMDSGYKATRSAAPDILRQQMGLVHEISDVLGLSKLDLSGYEADDIIATLATDGRDNGHEVLIVSGDRDVYQLVEDPHVEVIYNRRGVSDYVRYDEAGIRERTGVAPSDYVAYAALRGDPSDNLPGVTGVGEKTAAKLINQFGSSQSACLDGIFSSLEELTPRLRQSLAGSEAQVRRNAEMIRLVRDAPIGVSLGELQMGTIDREAVRKLFDFLEFRSLHERLIEVLGCDPADPGGAGSGADVIEPEVTVYGTGASAAAALLAAASPRRDPLALGTGPNGIADGLAFVLDARDRDAKDRDTRDRNTKDRDTHAAIPDAGHETAGARVAGNQVGFVPGRLLGSTDVLAALQILTGHTGSTSNPSTGAISGAGLGEQNQGGRPLAMHGAKSCIRELEARGIEVRSLTIDTMLAAYLLEPSDRRYDIGDLLERYTGSKLPETGPPEGELALDFGPDGQADQAGGEAAFASQAGRVALAVKCLIVPLREAMKARGLLDLNDHVEVPLVRVLARMEGIGIGVDPAVLKRIRDELASETEACRSAVVAAAGHEFNVNSTKQLREVLFNELGLTPQKRTKTGYSTDAQTLEKLRGDHPVIDHLLEYREFEKLRSTYGEGLLAEVGSGNRIRATFNQTVARTGRLSSDAPNLHNIPVRSERGRVFRTAFVAPAGHCLLVADYDQIELRCIAHLAEDPGLVAAFEVGDDIHTITAARIFGVSSEDVDIGQRARAKMVSYGLAYGMEAYGLAQRLNIATDEAAEILDSYFVAFPAVRDYMDRTVEEARNKGYTETLFGRRRQIPELASKNVRIRQAGERQAMNAGIQGLAADIFKVALVRLDAALTDDGLASRIVLQVHDEIILESPEVEVAAAADLTRSVMSSAFELRVPLEIDLQVAATWADAKG